MYVLIHFSCVWLFETLCIVAYQAPPGKNIGMGCHFLQSTQPGIEPMSLMSPALADGFFTFSATWETQYYVSIT